MKYAAPETLILPQVTEYIRNVITDTDGNEVFFICRPGTEGKIEEAVEVARGNKISVPAVLSMLRPGDVVLHNHPSGNLTPSAEDINVASRIADGANGFYITDNSVGKIYVVVKAFVPDKIKLISAGELISFFNAGGSIASKLDNYEYRKEQVEMVKFVSGCFNEAKIGLVEAGTGTGKSFAYLLPAIVWSLLNNERVVISTNTINLQEQLFYKDIPHLSRMTGMKFKWCLVKGRTNYLCLRKCDSAKKEMKLISEHGEKELADIFKWAETTADGSKSDLDFVPKDSLWEMFQCEADQCLRIKCPHYGKCFFYRSRNRAAYSNLIVVNHHILMTDIVLRKTTENYKTSLVLPNFKNIIIDEAHHIEDVATSNMGIEISRFRVSKIFGRLLRHGGRKSGLVVFIKKTLSSMPDGGKRKKTGIVEHIQKTLIKDIGRTEKEIKFLFEELNKIFRNFFKSSSETEKLRINHDVLNTDFWIDSAVPLMRELCAKLLAAGDMLKNLFDMIESEGLAKSGSMTSPLIELKSIAARIRAIVDDFRSFMGDSDENCRWVEFKTSRKSDFYLKFCSSPIIVADILKEYVYDKYNTIILTSATLSVNRGFDFIKGRLGINLVNERQSECLLLESPFDYKKQVFFGLPSGIPEPKSPDYTEMLRNTVCDAVRVSEGRALILFTSYNMLETIWALVKDDIENSGYKVLKQGEKNRYRLLEAFKKDTGSVLLATESFWEGIDVKGETLSLLVITRLPFKVPTEPVLLSRSEYISMSGGDSFSEYSLPLAVIKFRQGFGRLIRHRDDRGAVLVLDRRIISKRYGKVFLDSLPDIDVNIDAAKKLFTKMRKLLLK
ncbi:DEAD/DEAH box helicase family protein [bacterium]|jgi:ATP-dependent DNA helicase DinG|nr:DEAD/DEAH box helicase family protein [bacterium]